MASVENSEKSSCYLFIDNSNIFIEGKKFYAKKLGLNVPTDGRFRLDIGKLFYALVEGREVKFAKLYGSEPPALDSVWKIIREKGIQVDTYPRSSKDKEKEVDTALTADAVECCIEFKADKDNGTFILVAGDRDYKPCIEKILQRGWRIEIVSFSSCISKYLKKLTNKSVLVRSMDNIVWDKECYFINARWNKMIKVPRERTMAVPFSNLPRTVIDLAAYNLVEKVTSIFKFPCVYYISNNKEAVFVIICQSAEPHVKTFYSDKGDAQKVKQKPLYDFTELWRSNDARIKTECRVIFSTYKFEGFLTLVAYLQKFGQAEDPDCLQLTNRFESVGLDDDCYFLDEEIEAMEMEIEAMEMEAATFNATDYQDENNYSDYQERSEKEFKDFNVPDDTNNDDGPPEEHDSDAQATGWTVQARKQKNVKTGRYSSPCIYKFGCFKRGKCGWRHTVDERRYFKHHNACARGYKSKPCTRADCPFKKDSILCAYAHDEIEARCYICNKIGHYSSVERCVGVREAQPNST